MLTHDGQQTTHNSLLSTLCAQGGSGNMPKKSLIKAR